MRYLRRHADAINQPGVRVNGLADVHGVGAHLDDQGAFIVSIADHFGGMGAIEAAAEDLSVAPPCMAIP